MRFTFTATTVVVLVAAAFTGAAVVPRANVDLGLETRYYGGGKYVRDIPAAAAPKVVNRRAHPRDFRMARSVV
ncbi:hypothetical protein FPV67DRAFT_1481812 [Lyophyllum atratum]|nr:hypothetical protein FPV67DRAFT_1481812 [Lyophyllum atratum]